MTVRWASWIALLMLIFALGATSNAFAFRKGGCVRPEKADPDSSPAFYTVHGRLGTGFLVPETPHPAWTEQQPERTNDLFTVSLVPQLPYPNPHSGPVVVVVVAQRAEFRLELARANGQAIDEFDFRDVEPGVYRFTFDPPPRTSHKVVVTLLINGVFVAEMTARPAVMRAYR